MQVRLEPAACQFPVAADGDIPGTLKWKLHYSCTKPVDVQKDTVRDKQLAETLTSWNAKDPKQRPDMSKAAAERRAAGQGAALERAKGNGTTIALEPDRFTVLHKAEEGVAAPVLRPEQYEERHAQIEAAVSELAQTLASEAEMRGAGHGEREAQRSLQETTFVDWRGQQVVGAREEYAAARASLNATMAQKAATS